MIVEDLVFVPETGKKDYILFQADYSDLVSDGNTERKIINRHLTDNTLGIADGKGVFTETGVHSNEKRNSITTLLRYRRCF